MAAIAAGRRMATVQKLAWVYAVLFLGVVAVSHAPGLTDQEGYLLGQFRIDPIDDVVHAISGGWAALAAWRSPRAARFYFRAFGLFYTLDAFVGLFTGYSNLEALTHLGIAPGYNPADVLANLPPNLPHFVIGPVALLIGFLTGDARDTRRADA
jgi:hypothetical protein